MVATNAVIRINSFGFVPNEIQLKKGGLITWIHEDLYAHTHTINAENGQFESPELTFGKKYSHKIHSTGEFKYYCHRFPFMWGKLQVVDTPPQVELYQPSTISSDSFVDKSTSMKKRSTNALPRSFKTAVEMGLGGFQARDAFVHAASLNQVEVVKRWIDRHHDINLEDSEGQRALCVAAQNQCLEVLELLIEHGADINLSQKGGTTPLHIACTWGRIQAAQRLLVHKADPEVSDDDRQTPLHCACRNGHDEIVRMLLLAQVDPFVADEYGATPIYLAKDWQRIEILRMLEEYQGTVYRQLMKFKATLAMERVRDRVTHSMDIPIVIDETIHSFLC